MKTERWYEKISDLSELIIFLKSLDTEDRNFVAQHLVQILINECNIDLDSELSKFSKNDYSYKRWYDEDLDLSSSLELLKNMPKCKQDFVLKRLMTEIVMAFAKKEL